LDTAPPDAGLPELQQPFPWPAMVDGENPPLPFDLNSWQLEIDGLVAEPKQYTFAQLRDFPKITQNRRWITAMGWTMRAPWEGVLLQHLLDKARPSGEANFILQESITGQKEYLPLREAQNQRVLLAYGSNNRFFNFLYGGPLVAMVFNRYSYKGLAQLSRLTLVAEQDPEIKIASETRGYSRDGEVVPALMYAWDMRTGKPVKHSGEITEY